jgi:hypothetical protein
MVTGCPECKPMSVTVIGRAIVFCQIMISPRLLILQGSYQACGDFCICNQLISLLIYIDKQERFSLYGKKTTEQHNPVAETPQ